MIPPAPNQWMGFLEKYQDGSRERHDFLKGFRMRWQISYVPLLHSLKMYLQRRMCSKDKLPPPPEWKERRKDQSSLMQMLKRDEQLSSKWVSENQISRGQWANPGRINTTASQSSWEREVPVSGEFWIPKALHPLHTSFPTLA